MKKLLLTALLILGLSGLSFAATAVNTGRITPSYQKAFGGLVTANGNLTTLATYNTVITGVNVTSGSTANVVALYDASASVPTSVANAASVVFEAGAAANTNSYFDLSSTPIRTVNGLEVAESQSSGVIVYSVQYP